MCQAVASFNVPVMVKVELPPGQIGLGVAVTDGTVGLVHGGVQLILHVQPGSTGAKGVRSLVTHFAILLSAPLTVGTSPITVEQSYCQLSDSTPPVCKRIAFTPLTSTSGSAEVWLLVQAPFQLASSPASFEHIPAINIGEVASP